MLPHNNYVGSSRMGCNQMLHAIASNAVMVTLVSLSMVSLSGSSPYKVLPLGKVVVPILFSATAPCRPHSAIPARTSNITLR